MAPQLLFCLGCLLGLRSQDCLLRTRPSSECCCHQAGLILGASEIQGSLFWAPYNKDPIIQFTIELRTEDKLRRISLEVDVVIKRGLDTLATSQSMLETLKFRAPTPWEPEVCFTSCRAMLIVVSESSVSDLGKLRNCAASGAQCSPRPAQLYVLGLCYCCD